MKLSGAGSVARVLKSKSPIAPQIEPERRADLIQQIQNEAEMNGPGVETEPECIPEQPTELNDESTFGRVPVEIRGYQKKEEPNLSFVKFAEEIKIDFINSIDYRIMCRFLGATGVNDIKNHPSQDLLLINLLLMESVHSFMESNEFSFAGELNFDCNGNPIPPEKRVWRIKDKEIPFTCGGFLYFEKNGNKDNNVVFYLYCNEDRGVSNITCFTKDSKRSENIINDLREHTKRHNCLRGAKLRDINIYAGIFSEVELRENYNWDNYYYPKEIKDLFELEIFGFVKNIKKYNENNIDKRGVLMSGFPGVGKTSLGYIICNNLPEHTVIWITPEAIEENSYKTLSSIKMLYKLTDYVSPSIVILEDLDLFGQDREKGGDRISLGALMNILDGVNTIRNSATIATTNRINVVEEALRNRPGRFDRIVDIPPLDEELRMKMFKNRLKRWKPSSKILKHIVSETDEWTGAEAQEFINTLSLTFINSEKKDKKLTIEVANEVIEVMNKFGIKSSKVFGFNKSE